MPIEFRCTNCVRLLRVPEETAGRTAKCPGCGALMTIPGRAGHGESHERPEAGEKGTAPFSLAREGAEKGTVPFSLARKLGQSPAEENPYRSPVYSGELAPLGREGQAGTPAGRVVAPAIGLIAVAVIEIESLLFLLAATGAGATEAVREAGGAANAAVVGVAVLLAAALLGIVLSAVVIAGAVKMKNLEGRGLAMTAAVVVMLPVFFPGFVVGLPFGIWALVVLCDPQVKPLFETGQRYVY